ncbi:tRNA (adenosine(37)-N6)-dimethylallyltransferase MiaA [Pseudolabrys sp. FHR47]|uniref:tRNA (adenosine(37)-N6)-dimethylallyltransferase MiaA n=1 Tax=Pseudolabrys sp. FHR47 TaxID=2562284 RepID=UPI0010BEB121|nr:tRNA (adenosine(37)-N6)-dimethylallyltransferase MiaA [Pseudolabrys sp. FHR47]
MPDVKQAVLIAGPTASGKSALALALADRLGGTIVNADSMQVYAGLRVITARPTAEEEARAQHMLYGHVDAAESYSTGQWLREVTQVLDDIAAAGRVPIVVGGTGLYFKVLTEGIAAVPAIPAEIRESVRERLARDGVSSLYTELTALDPVTAARLMPLDRSRIARALEVVLATGRSISDWHGEGTAPLLPPERAVKIFVTLERTQLVSRIEARFAAMMQAGALDEVRALAARDLDPLLPAMKAHGVPWLIRHLKGEIPLDEAVAGSIMDTRRYAKRQHTWFRGQMKDWPMVPIERALDVITGALTD